MPLRILAYITAFLFLPELTLAQEVVIVGALSDTETNRPVSNAHVTSQAHSISDVSDAQGTFRLLIESHIDGLISISISHLSYEPKIIELQIVEIRKESVEGVFRLDVQLKRGVSELNIFEVTDDMPPKVVYANPRHSIADYELIGDSILLLTYEKTLRRQAKLYLSDLEMTLLDSITLSARLEPIGFQKDYTGRIFLRTDEKVFLIDSDANGLHYAEVDRNEFRDRIAPVIDSVGGRLLFSTWTKRYPAFDYFGYEATDSSYHHLRQIADEFMLELCRAEYKYLSTPQKLKLFRLELETGIEREVLGCIATFEEGLLYDPIHAPMFAWQDTIYIFDHHNDMLFIHDAGQAAIDSVEIKYHSPRKVMNNPFTDRLLMDEGTGEVYAIFQEPGGRCTLGLISKENGGMERQIDLTYDYPDGIRILDGEVYYIYRPFESMQKRYLYKEGIR